MVGMKIDIAFLSSTYRKWTECRIEQLQNIFKLIDKNVEIISSDKGKNSRIDEGYLPGGTVSTHTGKIAGMIKKNQSRKDKLGRWKSARIEGENRVMQVINIHIILDSTQEGILKLKAQCNWAGGEVKSSKDHEKDILKELTKEMQWLKNSGVESVFLAGDMNQDIESNKIQNFIRENRLHKIY